MLGVFLMTLSLSHVAQRMRWRQSDEQCYCEPARKGEEHRVGWKRGGLVQALPENKQVTLVGYNRLLSINNGPIVKTIIFNTFSIQYTYRNVHKEIKSA